MALALKWSLGLPYLCYVHGEDVGTAVNSREHRMLVARVLKGAKCCIANSQNSARLLREQWNVPEARVHVLNPGVDTNYFVPSQRDPEVRQRLGWHDRKVVLTVGRLQQRKGHDMLIRALPTIRDGVPNVLYAIVGEGEELQSLESLAGECGVQKEIQFLGNLGDSDLLCCYQQCDLFALPNREINGDIEGFGMVLVEAQACGKPVLAGRSGGTVETMNVGATGEVVPCESPAPLADAVTRLLLDDAGRAEMGRRARQHVVERFDWDELTLQARNLFESHSRMRDKRELVFTGK
jgi:phosphatidylinositol alpha-1,6-mannosyltransferase